MSAKTPHPDETVYKCRQFCHVLHGNVLIQINGQLPAPTKFIALNYKFRFASIEIRNRPPDPAAARTITPCLKPQYGSGSDSADDALLPSLMLAVPASTTGTMVWSSAVLITGFAAIAIAG